MPKTNGDAELSTMEQEEPSPSKEVVVPYVPRRTLTTNETDKVTRALADAEDLSFSDVDVSGYRGEMERYKQRSNKRSRILGEEDNNKRKVSCPANAT